MDESLDGRGRHQSQPTVTDTMRLWVGKWKHCKNDMESAFGEGLWKYWKSPHYFAPLGIVSNLGKKQKRLSSQGALCQDRPCFGGPVRFRGRRFSAFRLLSFFVSFSWQAEQQAHQETIAEHGEMMEKHQVQGWRGFLFQSTLNLLLFFILGTLLHNEFFVIFQYSTRLFFDIKLVLQDALVPYFLRLKKQLAMARYFSAFAFLPFAHSSAEVSIRSLRSKDARILGDMEDGWTWWTEWQVTWVTWKPHTHTHQVSSHAAALWDQPVREPPAADNPEVLLSSFWLQRNGFSFAHFLHFFEVAVMISNIFVCSWMRFPYSDWPGWTRREIAMLRMCTSFGARQ